MRDTKKAFLWIINILETNKIKYRISGGLAARVYGSNRKLADIDIEVLKKDINKIYKHVKNFVIYGPAIYKDENWDLMLMTLKFQEQEIDIASVDAKIFNQKTKRWIKKLGKIEDANLKNIFGIMIPVEVVNSLIKYKEILAREVDVEDIQQLKKII